MASCSLVRGKTNIFFIELRCFQNVLRRRARRAVAGAAEHDQHQVRDADAVSPVSGRCSHAKEKHSNHFLGLSLSSYVDLQRHLRTHQLYCICRECCRRHGSRWSTLLEMEAAKLGAPDKGRNELAPQKAFALQLNIIIPILFLLMTFFLLLLPLTVNANEVFICLAIIATGLPFWLAFVYFRKRLHCMHVPWSKIAYRSFFYNAFITAAFTHCMQKLLYCCPESTAESHID